MPEFRVKLRRSSTSGATPQTTDLELGELAVNTYDGKIFTKVDDGQESIVEVGVGTDLAWTASTRTISSSTGTNAIITNASTANSGLMSSTDKTKLNNIESGAEVNVGTDLSYVSSTREVQSSTGANAVLPEVVAGGNSGFITGSDKTKLDGIASGAQVNVGTDLSYTSATRVLASSTGTDVTLPLVVAGGTDGLMSGTDKTKLNSIQSNAQINVQSDWNATTGDALILNKPSIPQDLDDLSNIDSTSPTDGQVLTWDNTNSYWTPTDANNGVTNLSYDDQTRVIASSTGTNATLPEASATGNSGLMTSSDKSKLDGIETAATADQTGSEIKSLYEAESNTNAFTDAEKTKLSGIATGAEVNVQSDWNSTSGDSLILNKPTIYAEPGIFSGGGTPTLASGVTGAEIRTLIGAGTSSFDGAYSSLTGTPTIPTNNNQLTNGAGYITSTGAKSFSNSTASTPTLTLSNSGGDGTGTDTGAILLELNGDSDSLIFKNINDGDYGIYNSQQANGIEIYDGTGGVQILYDGVERLIFGASGNNAWGDFKGTPSVNSYVMWHSGNDGASTGLDAGLLDGADGSYYLDYNNFTNTPTFTASFDGLTGKTSGTGDYSTTGDIVSGRGSGGVALTINDGKGNANVTFNHQDGTPEQNGNAARIKVNCDSTSNANINFEAKSNVTGGTNVGLTSIFNMSETGATCLGNTVWHAGNDGSGSGLDADTVDGFEASSFLRSDADDAASGQIKINDGSANPLELERSSQVGIEFNDTSVGSRYLGVNSGNLYYGSDLNHGTNSKVWHAGNDGSGSGLDADLLDGQEGSYYQNASNLNAGTIPDARISDIGDSEARIITFDNLEKGNLTSDGQLSFDSSQGLILYRTQQGVNTAVTVLDGANVDAGANISISNIDAGTTGTGAITFAVIQGPGSNLDADTLDNQEGSYYTNASNISSGTIDTARLPATYTKASAVTIQATGAANDLRLDAADHIILESGEEEDGNIYFRGNGGTDSYRFAKSGQTAIEGFLSFESLTADRTYTFPDAGGTIALTSDLTGSFGDADTLDGVQGSNYLRSDVEDQAAVINIAGEIAATSSAKLQVYGFQRTGPVMVAVGTTATTSFNNTNERWILNNGTDVYLSDDGQNYNNKAWHAGNDGSGSGLDADTIDGLGSANFLRANANDNVTGHTEWQDTYEARFGNAADLRIHHTSGNNFIDSHNGHIYIRANCTSDLSNNIYIQAKSGEHSIIVNDDSSVQLYNNGTQCLQTRASGDVRIYRNLEPDVTNSNDLGTSSLKWHEAYLNHWYYAQSLKTFGTDRFVLGHDGFGNNSGTTSWAQFIVEDTGEIIFGKDFADWGIAGGQFENKGARQIFTTGTGHLWRTNSSSATIVSFYSNSTFAGQIQLNSATVVAYVGGHLSRYSQFLNDERPEVLLGTVLSNLDEMCEWSFDESPDLFYEEGDILPEGKAVGDLKAIGVQEEEAGIEDNLQLNRVKISDVIGDKNVTGIFSQYEDDDVNDPHARKYDKYDDFTIAQSGDFVIRIGKDVVIERGDLLMSAGDGTAMPQDDDIVRSCTIAKVNSTSVRKVYPDGSYLVPCTLML